MISRGFGLLAALAALTLAGLGDVSAPAVAQTREGHFRVGVLVFGVFRGPLWTAFAEELRRLGYVVGQNTTLEVREAENQEERLPVLAAELVALHPEVIFTSAPPPIRALKKVGTSIPVVFAGIGDPVRLGVVESIPRPGGNFTGISNRGDELVAKRLQLLKELVPDIIRVAMFQNPLNPGVAITVEEVTKNSKVLGMEMIPVEIKRGEDLPEAIEQAVQAGAQALMITPDAITFNYRSTIIDLLLQKRLPAVYPTPIEARDGGLIAYGTDIEAHWRRAAVYVDKILRGAKPADLPVEQGDPILAINLKTAAVLDIQVPLVLLQRAEQIIE
jgi:putative tryptophan/tyrosine transport system substrate-binding protein